jgi:hypothetical protein
MLMNRDFRVVQWDWYRSSGSCLTRGRLSLDRHLVQDKTYDRRFPDISTMEVFIGSQIQRRTLGTAGSAVGNRHTCTHWEKCFLCCPEIVRMVHLAKLPVGRDPEVLGSIPGASRFSEKGRVWNGVHSASWGQLRSYLEEIVAAPVKKTETNDRGDPLRCPRDTLYPQKVGITSPTNGGRSVCIVRSRTKATEFVCFVCLPVGMSD